MGVQKGINRALFIRLDLSENRLTHPRVFKACFKVLCSDFIGDGKEKRSFQRRKEVSIGFVHALVDSVFGHEREDVVFDAVLAIRMDTHDKRR